MTDREKMEALLRGERLGSSSWDSRAWISLSDSGDIVDQMGCANYLAILEDANCIYQEKNNFAWAKRQVESGKAVRRLVWGEHLLWRDNELALEDRSGSQDYGSLDLYDLDADDWVLA